MDGLTKVVIRSPDAVIASARLSNFRAGYEFALREGGGGGAQFAGLVTAAGLASEPFYLALGRGKDQGLAAKAEYKRQYERVKSRSTYFTSRESLSSAFSQLKMYVDILPRLFLFVFDLRVLFF